MNVLMVEPGKAPYETQIGDDLQSMVAVRFSTRPVAVRSKWRSMRRWIF